MFQAQHKSQGPNRCRIFVGRLPESWDVEHLRAGFEQFGQVLDCHIPPPKRGFGFVTFMNAEVSDGVFWH